MEFLLIVKYVLLGLLQGITEPIPVSSSGHVLIAQHLFGIEIEGFHFELLVNSASLLAVLVIYRKALMETITGTFKFVVSKERKYKSDFKFAMYVVLATIPVGVVGVLFQDVIAEYLKGIKIIGISLLVTAVALFAIRKLRGSKLDGDLNVVDAIIVGLAQMVALIPGISRSGATLVAAMGRGMRQDTALKFSFYLYIPVSLGGVVLAISDLIESNELATMFVPYSLAFIVSFIASYFALKWFMDVMRKGNLIYFSIYCLALGLFVLFFF